MACKKKGMVRPKSTPKRGGQRSGTKTARRRR